MIDLDELDRISPAPPDDPYKTRLTARNLAAVWENFRAAGATRIIIVGIMLCLERELSHIETAIPDADITVVRLRAGEETLSERVWRREIGSGGAAQVRRSLDQSLTMDRESIDDCLVVVETSRCTVPGIAGEILNRSGWTL